MKYLYPLLFLLFLSVFGSAQNTPCTALSLPNDMPDFQTYSTAGMSNSGVPDPGCGAPVNVDIWFAVVAPPSGDMDIATLPGTMFNAAMAVYLGPCNNLTLIACTDDDNCGNTIMPVAEFNDLIPGQTYYIRIWPEGAGGSFEIRVTDGPAQQDPINMSTVGSAQQTGPGCIQLTPNTTAQAGCAYETSLADFSQPFTSTYILNFGNSDAGADGICMIYHNDPAGANACGNTGGDIAAMGIQNSLIIEFDTWDNGGAPPFSDIPQDHVAVAVNGVLGPPIQGPVSLGNIEDGQDHEVTFSWNPVGNQFSVSFDGVPYITGTYDVINNCFGGQTTAWCGFTASTGGATNTQTVCTPEPLNLPAGNETMVVAEICQGEQYFAGGGYQTTSGTYFDFLQAYNGCDSTIITELTVHPLSNTTISETICAGDCVTVGGIDYCNTGFFQQNYQNYLGCDSTVFINVLSLDPTAEIQPPSAITCDNPIVVLDGTASNVGPGMTYFWEGPSPTCFNGSVTAPQVGVNCPGEYTLTVSHTVGNVTCTVSSAITVVLDVETIDIAIVPADTIDCSTSCVLLDASGSSSGPLYDYSWTGPNGFTSDEFLPTVCDSGQYVLTIENPSNGCTGQGGIEVTANTADVEALAGPDGVLNCSQPEIVLDGSSSTGGPGVEFQWYDEQGQLLGADSTQMVDQPGSYVLEVLDVASGCTALDTVVITQNLNTPVADAGADQVLDCTGDPATLDGSGSSGGPNLDYQWLDTQGNSVGQTVQTIVSDPGEYLLLVTDNQSGCTDTATVQVDPDLNAPVADGGPDQLLTCTVNTVTLNGGNSTTGADITYQWEDAAGNVLSNSLLFNVSDPADYFLIVTNTSNNCVDTAEVEVVQDTLTPLINPGPDTLLNCYFPTITIGDAQADTSWTFNWTDGNGNSLGSNPTLPVSGADDYSVLVTNPINGCTSTAEVSVTDDSSIPTALVDPPPTINCLQSTVALDGTASAQGSDITYEWLDPQGQTAGDLDTLLVDIPGEYTFLVLDTGNGCADTTTVTVSEDLALPDLDAGADTLLNCYHPTIDLIGSTSLANGTYTFSWQDAMGNHLGTGPNLPVDQNGDYVLVISSQVNGCENTDTVLVSADFATPIADAGTDQVIDCQSGAVQLDGSNSSAGADINLLWLNDNDLSVGTNPQISVDEAGLYSLIATNTLSGCADTSQVNVTLDADVPIADAGLNGLLTCTTNIVTLDGANSSSGPDIIQSWYDEQDNLLGSGPTLDVSTGGVFTLEVINQQNGCSSVSNVSVAVDTLAPVSDPGPDQTLNCTQPTLEIGGNSSTGPAISYTWEDAMGLPLGSTDSITVAAGGVYSLTVNNSDNGCQSEATVTVSEDLAVPPAEAGPSLFLNCNQPQGNLDGSNSAVGPDITYTWTNNQGQIVGTDPVLPNPPEGLYTLEVLDTGNGCTATDDAIVSEDFIIPMVEAGSDQLLNCTQPVDTLSALGSAVGPNYELEWQDVNGNVLGSDLTIPVGNAGVYYVEITDLINGCTSLDSVVVNEDFALPLAEAGDNLLLNCDLPATVVNGNNSSVGPDFTYSWLDAGGNLLGSDLVQNVDTSGTVYLVVTDISNGCSATDSVTVTEDFATPTASAGMDAIVNCYEPTVSLDGSSSSAGPAITYLWTDQGGVPQGTANSLTVSEGGTYILSVEDTGNGCMATDTVQVAVDQEYPTAVLNVNDLLTCVQLTATLDATGTSGGSEYELFWNTLTGGAITPGSDPLQPTVSDPGIYQLIVQNTINGCADTTQAAVDQNIEPPVAEAGADVHLNCFQETGTLDGSQSGPTGNLSFVWTGPVDGDPNAATVGVSVAGIYSLLVTDVSNGCTATDEVEVTSSFLETLSVSTISPPCPGETGSLSVEEVTGGTTPYLYSIDGGETFFTETQFVDLPAGVYPVVVQDADGCTLDETAEVAPPLDILVLLEAEAMLELGDTYQIAAATNFPVTEIASISWTPATGLSCTDCLTPEASPQETTEYTIVVENANGCVAEATVRLVVDKSARIFVPNVFSPDFDGINDQFTVFADPGSVDEIQTLRIFDRWGEPVFTAFNIPPNALELGWDGTYRGEPVQQGVYVWFAELVFPDGRVEIIKGDVTVVR